MNYERQKAEVQKLWSAFDSQKQAVEAAGARTAEVRALERDYYEPYDEASKAVGLAEERYRRLLEEQAEGTMSYGGLADAFRREGFPGKSAVLAWPEFKALLWSGSVDTLHPIRRPGAPLRSDQRYLWPVLPQEAVGGDVTAIQVLRQASRTLPSAASVVRSIDAITVKPEVDSALELLTVPMKQVAAIETNVPNVILSQRQADQVIETDLRLALNEGLDKLVLDAVAASGFQAPGTDPLLVSIRKAITTVSAAGYNPDTLVLTPAASQTLDTLQDSANNYIFGAGRFAPGQLFGLNVRVSKTVAAPIVVDASAFGRLHASPVRLDRFEADSGTTNRSNVRMELHAAVAVHRQNAAIRVAAA